MAEVINRQTMEILVDYYGFALQEADESQIPAPFPEGRAYPGTAFLISRPMRVDVDSAGHTHEAPLAVEVWDGEPPVDHAAEWEARGEITMASPTGQLSVWVIAGRVGEHIELGRTKTTWRVRIYCAGRKKVAHLAQFGVPEGVERYLVQLWPVT
ncbi:hypothetical protein ACMA1D_13950 [Streptomyces sp. 796.1]|uniref:hypothetical protein n=1 Tax=Streptomyces sp. 796.1 TaxID=3163029 RepID=UPI0039C954E8